jgi:hypothetical protein
VAAKAHKENEYMLCTLEPSTVDIVLVFDNVGSVENLILLCTKN